MSKVYKHEWHLISDYCIHCGMSRVHELDAPRPCIRDKKIIPISHKTVGKHVIRTSAKDSNSNS